MAASYLTKQIEQRRNRIEEKRKLADTSSTPLEFDIWEFTYPMLVSVITFGIILQSIGEKAVDSSVRHSIISNRLFLANGSCTKRPQIRLLIERERHHQIAQE